MATTTFLSHTLGLVGCRHLRTRYEGGSVLHHVEKAAQKRYCRGCGGRWTGLTLSGALERKVRALPVGRKPPFVVLHGHEQTCRR